MNAKTTLYGEGLTSDDMTRRAVSGDTPKGPMASAAPNDEQKQIAQYWREIERYRQFTSDWHQAAKNIEQLYLDEDRAEGSSTRRFSLLWSNVETLKPAVYAKLPTIQCSRRYKDKDPVARTAAEIIERATNTSFEIYDVDEVFQMVRDDRLLPGRGQAWVRYEADIETYALDDGETETGEQPAEMEGEPKTADRLNGERVCIDYVHWGDFGHNVAGTWSEVWLVWRCVYKTQDEITERFGADIAAMCSYDAKAPAMPQMDGTGETAEEFCRIYELWDKRRRKVTWITEGMKSKALESGPPPINFGAFFPCPRPCYATKTSRKLIPRPDYAYYRDQAKEINDLTDKIGNMCDWLVVKAFVPGGPSSVADPIEEAIRENSNRELFVPVDSMSEWTERGGAAKLIDWMPIDMIVKAIQSAIAARNQLIQDVFQITGISDILRGQTDPTETLGAQELKAQTGSRRLRNVKDEVARFCRDVGRLAAEVAAEKFEPETLAELSGYRYIPTPEPLGTPLPGVQAIGVPPLQLPLPLPGGSAIPAGNAALPQGVGGPQAGGGGGEAPMGQPTPPAALPAPEDASSPSMTFGDDVIELLRNDRLRSFRIDVETDSTGQADENAEKQAATDFVTSTSGFIEKAGSMLAGAPELAPLMGEMLMFAVRRYRAGRSLEDEIEKTFGAIAKKAQAAQQQPQPSPEQIKAEAEAKAQQQRMAEAAQKHQQDMQRGAQEAAAKQQEHAARMAELQQQQVNAQEQHVMKMAELEQQAENSRLAEIASANDAARRAAEREQSPSIPAVV